MKVPILRFHQTKKHLSKSLYIWSSLKWWDSPAKSLGIPSKQSRIKWSSMASTIQQRAQLLIDPDRIRCRAESETWRHHRWSEDSMTWGCIRSRNHWDNQKIFGSYPVVACVGRGNWMWVFVMVLYLHMMVQLFNRQTRLNHHFLQRKSEHMSPFKSSFWFK